MAEQLSTLLGNAGLDAEATSQMLLTADELGAAIEAGMGAVSIDDVKTTEVVLATELLDDSSSINFAGNAQAVRDGHNLVLESLRESKQSAGVLISCRYLNDAPGTNHGVLFPYRPLSGALRLDANNYNPSGGTPFYDQTAITLTGVAAKMSEFEDGGVPARAITVLATDGVDQHSRLHTTASCERIISGLLASEKHIIAGMGISDVPANCLNCAADLLASKPVADANASISWSSAPCVVCPRCHEVVGTDFEGVFTSMGIQRKWILTPGNTPSEIRSAFQVWSQSAVRASQTATMFSQTALGGFGS